MATTLEKTFDLSAVLKSTLPDSPAYRYSDEEKTAIIKAADAKGSYTGTEAADVYWLSSAISPALKSHKLFSLFKKKQTTELANLLATIMAHGRYFLSGNTTYIPAFKSDLETLKKKCTELNIETDDLLKILCDFSKNDTDTNKDQFRFLGILPIAIQEIAKIDRMHEIFYESELFGHGIAYDIGMAPRKTYNKVHIETLEGNNKKTDTTYNVHEINVKVGKEKDSVIYDDALRGSILIPEHIENLDEPTVYINWMGTASMATLSADLQISAGEEVFRRGEVQILDQIFDQLNSLPPTTKPIKIVVTGHSLGGALSQLAYNAIQRRLALSSNVPEIRDAAKLEEQRFSKDPQIKTHYNTGIQKKGLDDVKVGNNFKINEMELKVWNSTRVLPAVAISSNALSPLLVKLGVKQTASYGIVGGDAVSSTGSRLILDDIETNDATVNVMKVEPNTTRSSTTWLGVVGSIPVGMVLASPLGAPILGAVAVGTLTGTAALTKLGQAHTQKNYTNGLNAQTDLFHMHSNRHSDGTLNPSECLAIRKDTDTTSKTIVMAAQKTPVMVKKAITTQYTTPSKIDSFFRRAREAHKDKGETTLNYNNTLKHLSSDTERSQFATRLMEFVTKTDKDENPIWDINQKDKYGKTLWQTVMELEDNYSLARILVTSGILGENAKDLIILTLHQHLNALNKQWLAVSIEQAKVATDLIAQINVDKILPKEKMSPFLTFISHLQSQKSAVSDTQASIAKAFIEKSTSLKDLESVKTIIDEWAENPKASKEIKELKKTIDEKTEVLQLKTESKKTPDIV